MNPFRSSAAEQALRFPDVAGWTQTVPQTRNQHRWAFAVLMGVGLLILAISGWRARRRRPS